MRKESGKQCIAKSFGMETCEWGERRRIIRGGCFRELLSQAQKFLLIRSEKGKIMNLYEKFDHLDKNDSYGSYGRNEYGGNGRQILSDGNDVQDSYDDDYRDDYYDDDGYGCDDDDYGYDDDEIGYLNRELWEYEAEFDRAAREIEKSHRSPAAKILFGLLVIAAVLAIYLGVSEYAGGDGTEEAEVRVSFVRAGEPEEDRISAGIS